MFSLFGKKKDAVKHTAVSTDERMYDEGALVDCYTAYGWRSGMVVAVFREEFKKTAYQVAFEIDARGPNPLTGMTVSVESLADPRTKTDVEAVCRRYQENDFTPFEPIWVEKGPLVDLVDGAFVLRGQFHDSSTVASLTQSYLVAIREEDDLGQSNTRIEMVESVFTPPKNSSAIERFAVGQTLVRTDFRSRSSKISLSSVTIGPPTDRTERLVEIGKYHVLMISRGMLLLQPARYAKKGIHTEWFSGSSMMIRVADSSKGTPKTSSGSSSPLTKVPVE